jgi:hypothetical protein
MASHAEGSRQVDSRWAEAPMFPWVRIRGSPLTRKRA